MKNQRRISITKTDVRRESLAWAGRTFERSGMKSHKAKTPSKNTFPQHLGVLRVSQNHTALHHQLVWGTTSRRQEANQSTAQRLLEGLHVADQLLRDLAAPAIVMTKQLTQLMQQQLAQPFNSSSTWGWSHGRPLKRAAAPWVGRWKKTARRVSAAGGTRQGRDKMPPRRSQGSCRRETK